ncbi:hypothetical protein H2200_009384 [Cladophialophora chaetospira]|uniref:Thiaminase-2/PQQC domain-containing protein n=1 Tax=Cladophialophora chaetospira TaxID=386627 RepID=A0AA38X428_9EURO|nr:hypothetical protein H2200_009384 [Cladophialophora chaetospira]
MWHNQPDHSRQQSPPGPGPYFHHNTMSDQMSVSSATTGVTSPQGQPPPQNYNTNYQPPNPNSYNSPTYLYPSSHIHNQPLQSHPPPHRSSNNSNYISSPPAFPLQPPPSLTNILLSSSPNELTLATNHPFLRLAGQGHLPARTLSRWLSQDRLYAQSYIGFIGALIARVDLPYVSISAADKTTSLRWRIIDCLTSAIQNIRTELSFFDSTAEKYALDLQCATRADGLFTAEPATKQYIDLFRAFWTDPSMSLLEGMVVLWATETCYLRAWGYAKSFITAEKKVLDERDRDRKSKAFSDGMRSELEGSEVNTALSGTTGNNQVEDQQPVQNTANDLDGGALREAFIPNWTSKEFEGFVAEIAELTDLLAEREDAVNRKLDVYKAVWRHILDVERRFWPDVGVSD